MMVISLFFLITIPIYILGFGIYHWGYQTIKREIISGLKLYPNEAWLTPEDEIEQLAEHFGYASGSGELENNLSE